ncbi:MAG: hypothetical protein Q8O40_14400 [Chloroflexota bacterium]|nr:hypothetical protein [Chloroflexota bacterium]
MAETTGVRKSLQRRQRKGVGRAITGPGSNTDERRSLDDSTHQDLLEEGLREHKDIWKTLADR